jgi:hypothetical protein
VTRRAAPRVPCFAGRPFVEPDTAGPLAELLAEPERPMFAFDRELGALERAFYRHLLRAIDLDALFELEQLLWSELDEVAPFTDEQVLDLANAMLARALERVAHDPVRSMRLGTRGPGGQLVEAPEAPHEGCPFCGPLALSGGGGSSSGGGGGGQPRAGRPREAAS